MKVEIPEGKNCAHCLFCYEQIDSFDYEESHDHCAYLNKPLNDEVPYPHKRIKKHPDCPAHPDKKRVPIGKGEKG